MILVHLRTKGAAMHQFLTHCARNITKDVQVFPTFSWLQGVYRVNVVELEPLQNCHGRVIYSQILPQSSDYC